MICGAESSASFEASESRSFVRYTYFPRVSAIIISRYGKIVKYGKHQSSVSFFSVPSGYFTTVWSSWD